MQSLDVTGPQDRWNLGGFRQAFLIQIGLAQDAVAGSAFSAVAVQRLCCNQKWHLVHVIAVLGHRVQDNEWIVKIRNKLEVSEESFLELLW